MRTPFHPASAVAALMIVFSTAGSAVAQTSPGWMYTINTTTDSGGAKRSSMAMKIQVTDRRLRFEFVQVSGLAGAADAEGMAQILDDRDSSITMLMTKQHTAMVMQLGGMSGMLGGRQGLTPKFEQHITSTHTDDLGPGERILGHATHRYRVTQTGTVDVTSGDQTCTRRIDSVEELWMAPDVDLMPAMQTMMKHYTSVLGQPNNASDPGRPNTTDLKGTALRTVAKSTGVDATGRQVPVTTTREYIEMSQAPIAASVFMVPADFQTMDMRKMMAEIPAGVMDSAMAQGAAKARTVQHNAVCGTGTP